MENNAITVETTVNSPVEKVWDFWTNPEHITKWSFASPDWHTPYADNDLRVGGEFKSTMAAKDGSMSFDFGGTYTTVDLLKKIEYTLGDGRKVSIIFDALSEGTRVTETFDPEGTNPIEMQRGGWQAILDNFKKYTEES
ncbi:polyketide cyclase [Pedobacter sp. HDW13]|uniref:SRPBCC family protein n=1 Tax=Pedobacter sp. HDW13 TaxID=2714940 RepID=UPI00140E7715|nr:SRPBCC family protein [Pedobacter sp. HDW13]QIL41244.1 polyketide cyclase [Pedobacter sp. HDW13]